MYEEALERCALPPLLQEAVIILLLKPGKVSTTCSSYTPLSLLNLDNKIVTKILATILSLLMEEIISRCNPVLSHIGLPLFTLEQYLLFCARYPQICPWQQPYSTLKKPLILRNGRSCLQSYVKSESEMDSQILLNYHIPNR